jgi:hypothetical protein
VTLLWKRLPVRQLEVPGASRKRRYSSLRNRSATFAISSKVL